MFLIQQFDNDPRLLKSLCRLPRVIDIIRQFYWDNVKSRYAIGSKPLLHPITKQAIGERPSREEIRKLCLLLLSLGEMSLRQNIARAYVNALIAFCETSQDMTCIEDVLHMVIQAISQKVLLASFLEQVNLVGGSHFCQYSSKDMTCIEDVLHMVIRAISQKVLLASFLEQVNLVGGCHIFVDLLQRQNIAAADVNALIAFCETSQDMACIKDVLHMVIWAISQKVLLAVTFLSIFFKGIMNLSDCLACSS